MAIPARLSRILHETFGEEAGREMVDWMDRVDSQRTELREFHDLSFARIDERFNRIDDRLGHVEGRLDRVESRLDRVEGHVGALRQEMDARFLKVAVRFDQMEASIIGRLEAKIEQRTADLMKWSFLFWCGAVAAVAALAGVLG